MIAFNDVPKRKRKYVRHTKRSLAMKQAWVTRRLNQEKKIAPKKQQMSISKVIDNAFLGTWILMGVLTVIIQVL